MNSGFSHIRALHVIPDNPVGSYNIFARREAASLSDVGVEVASFYLTSRTSPRELLRLRREFRRILKSFSPDLVHVHFGTVTAFFCAVNCGRVPFVITFRGGDLNPDPSVGRLRSIVGRTLSRIAAAMAFRNICVTRQLAGRLWWGKSNTVIMPGSVNLKLFQPIPVEEARKQLGWNLESRIVLFNAGRFPKVKRPDLAAAAVRSAKELLARIELVSLNGDVDPDKMPAIYSAADCLLVTSDYEGSPTVVREAMACNLPVISVDVGDVAERIRHDRHSRIVPRDPRVIGSVMATLLRAPRRSNGRAAVAEIEEARVARRLREIYDDVIAASQRTAAVPVQKQTGYGV